MNRTYLAPESDAYPRGGQTRRCKALCADGKVRVVWAGIPDTYFSIPAHARINGRYARGFLTMENGEVIFNAYAKKGGATHGA